MPTTDELQAQINALQSQLNSILGMADDDYIHQYSGEEIDAGITAAGGAVRYDLAQSLTSAQQAQARENIGADAVQGAVRYDQAQSLTTAQQAQARENIAAANKETQDKVMATALSTVRVTLSPAELPAYIAALPRLLDKYYEITLTAGTCTTPLNINQFYGFGYLMIIGASNLGSVFTGGVSVERTRVPVRLRGLSVSGLIGDATVSALTSAYLYMDNCTVDCTGATYGIKLYDSANASFNNCTISNCSTGKVLICAYGSIGTFTSCTMTNNKIGAWVYHGGIVLLAGDTPDTMGGSANQKNGGLIVKENGTLL